MSSPSTKRSRHLVLSMFAVGAAIAVSVPSVMADFSLAESFRGARLVSDDWIMGGTACLSAKSRNGRIPGCEGDEPGWSVDEPGSGVARLTSLGGGAGFLLYNSPVPADSGLDVFFYASQWGGAPYWESPGDGMSFFLVDGSVDLVAPGAGGSALGYTAEYEDNPGVEGALLGIGMDTYGGFSGPDGHGTGCDTFGPGLSPNHLVVRGPGNGFEGYCFLDSVDLTTAGINLYGDDREANDHLVRIRIDSTDVTDRMVQIYVDGVQLLELPLPVEFAEVDTVKFGFSAATGAAVDNHELWGLSVFVETQAEDFVYEAPTVEDDNAAIAPPETTPELPPTGARPGSSVPLALGLIGVGLTAVIMVRRRTQAGSLAEPRA